MLRAILVDAEQPSLDLLEKLLISIGNIEIVGMFTNPDEAINKLLRKRKSQFICFGRFEWISDANAELTFPVKWRTSKERELMAYLVHHRNTFITKGKILEDIWPNANLKQGITFLHTCIYSIRKKIASVGDNYKLEYHNNCYRLETRGGKCDVAEFERVTSGEMVITPDSIGEFEKTANLYKSNYMEEDGFVWAQQAQEKYKSDYFELMRRLADYHLSRQNYRAAGHCLRRVLLQNPYLDDINERMLRVYAKMGDRLSMQQHYERFTKLLQEELGTTPLKSTVQLFSELYYGDDNDDESKA